MTPPPRDHRPEDPDWTLPVLLRQAADVLEADPAECPDAAKSERLLSLVGLSGRLDAAIAREVGVFDANTVWAGDGSRSAAAWLQARTELPDTRSRAIVHTARDLRACPAVEAAWAAGNIGTAKVHALLRARTTHPRLFAQCEAALVDEVTPMTVACAAARIAQWAAIAEATRDAEQAENAGEDPDDTAEADPMADNALYLSQSLGGRWIGDASYDPVSGAEIHDAITAEIDARFAAGTYRADDGMTPAQRRAQCGHDLIVRGRTPTQTQHGEVRPSVSVEIDARTLAGIPITDDADARTRHCQLANGTPIARTTAERLLCTCRLTAIATKLALSGEIEITGITDWTRDATAKQRKALRKRDGGCVFTGCGAPFDWCEAHHLWQHDLGGPTLLANLVLLCKHHHHLVHEGGWHLWRDQQDGHLYLCKPDGTPVPIVRHGDKIPLGPAPPQPPPPLLRNGPPRLLTPRERAELDHRRRNAEPTTDPPRPAPPVHHQPLPRPTPPAPPLAGQRRVRRQARQRLPSAFGSERVGPAGGTFERVDPAVAPDPVVERIELDATSWVDVVRGFVTEADELHDVVAEATRWSEEKVFRYDHWVEVNRLGGWWRRGDPVAHPVLLDAHRWLQHRYHVQFDGFSLVRYRDGRDGQGFHRDRDMRWLEETVIGVLTLGAQRPWLLRPRSHRNRHDLAHRGATHDLSPASGDLLVMGGRCQADWEHSVAPVPDRRVDDRISLQWRWTSRHGRPEQGASWNAPRHYGRG